MVLKSAEVMHFLLVTYLPQIIFLNLICLPDDKRRVASLHPALTPHTERRKNTSFVLFAFFLYNCTHTLYGSIMVDSLLYINISSPLTSDSRDS